MEQKKIDRINELARKAKSPAGLTPEEEAERALLRQEYIAACKSNLMAHLDNTLIQHCLLYTSTWWPVSGRSFSFS